MQSQEPAITASNYLIQELEHNRVSFFNRALVSQEEIEIGEEFNPMNEYPLQMLAVGPQVTNIQESHSNHSNDANINRTEEEIVIKPVLYTPPAWLDEADNEYVDELLRQSGYDTTESKRGYKRKRQECMNDNTREESDPTARSSTDMPETAHRHRSSMDMSDMEIEEEDTEAQDCPSRQPAQEDEIREENDQEQNPNIDSSTWWPSGYYFGDGSGGKYSRYPTLTRCGVGVQYVDEEKEPRTNIYTPLPGLIQSNNRAELYALWIVVTNIEIVGKIDFFTDNKIVRDTILKGKLRARLANHGDLWAEISEQIERKRAGSEGTLDAQPY